MENTRKKEIQRIKKKYGGYVMTKEEWLEHMKKVEALTQADKTEGFRNFLNKLRNT